MSNTDSPSTPASTGAAPGARLSTTINVRKWLVKMLIFGTALLVLGVWGYLDATIIYPKRGRESAEHAKLAYLRTLAKDGQLLSDRVEDPAAEFKRLSDVPEIAMSDIDRARLTWLTALSRIHSLSALTAENKAAGSTPTDTTTLFKDPNGALAALEQQLSTKKQPSPLSAFDIPVQWLFVAIGFGGAAYVAFLIFRVARTKFHYVPSEHRLILPDGREIVPSDVKEVDKRKWHKFYSSFILNDGSVVELDLLRFVPLEEWFLEMEKRTPGYVPPPPEPVEEVAEGEEKKATE